jgi:hypothetical protein
MLGGLVLAGAATVTSGTGAQAATTGWTPRTKTVDALRAGDMVVGAEGVVVRVAAVATSGGTYAVHYTDPHRGASATLELGAYPATQKFLVLARGVPAGAVQLTAGPGDPPVVIDGGSAASEQVDS